MGAAAARDRETSATVTAGGEAKAVAGYTVTFIPPGDSTIRIGNGGRFVRLFTTNSADLAELCPNTAAHATRHENVPAFEPWPVPPDGYKIRTYTLDVPDEPAASAASGAARRSWSTTSPRSTGRATSPKLSPHHHDDFEQYSLCRGGLIHPPSCAGRGHRT